MNRGNANPPTATVHGIALRVVALTLCLLAVGAGSAGAVNPFRGLGVSCDTLGRENATYAEGVNCRHIVHQRYPRRFVVEVPDSAMGRMDRGRRVPLVLMLHGSSGTGEKFWRISGWKEKAEQEGFVAAFPTGLAYDVLPAGGPRVTKWNSYDLPGTINPYVRPPGWRSDLKLPADDIGFLRRMIGSIRRRLRIDARRIYIAGFSDGSQMTTRVAVEMTDVVASIAGHAGNLADVPLPLAGNPYMPALMSLGTLDDRPLGVINEAQDPDIAELPLAPADIDALLGQYMFDPLLDAAGLAPQPRRDITTPTTTEMIWETPLLGNTSGNRLHFLMLDDVEHVYPNGTGQRGGNPHAFKMTDRVWPFFRRNPKR